MVNSPYKHLFNLVMAITKRYEEVGKQNHFNIFKILRSGSDEVNVHSRFIFELLNAKSTHYQGSIFLQRFIEYFELDIKGESVEDFEVHKEKDHIDISIRHKDKKQAFIIENKIFADDQPAQLERYYETLIDKGFEEEGVRILYLTLDSHPPSDNSLGKLKGTTDIWRPISYGEIIEWLDLCLKEVSLFPTLRETIAQYQYLLKILTGDTMEDKEKDELFVLLDDEANYEAARRVESIMPHYRIELRERFWDEVESEVKERKQKLSAQVGGRISGSWHRRP